MFLRHRWFVPGSGALLLLQQQVRAATFTADCDTLSSCSPSSCVTSNEPDCSLNINAPSWSSTMSTLSCSQSCTPTTHGVCRQLASVLRTAASGRLASGVQAAWCNENFLVIASDGLPHAYDPSSSDYLGGIPLPPGGDTACRVRTASAQTLLYKVPLAPTVSMTLDGNVLPSPLPNVDGMPEAGAMGVAINGVPIFPNYNNRGQFAWVSCEVDRCNAHSGKGDDYHYHGDPFGTKCLYDESDYDADAAAHPPLIGFALDGFVIYGRYTQTSQLGQSVALDRCGGHEHAGVSGYHYHPELATDQSTSKLDGVSSSGPFSYTAFKGSPMECWRGDVSQVSNFWTSNGRQANYDSTKAGVGSRNDLEELRPCCGMAVGQYYAASGIMISGASSSGNDNANEDSADGADGADGADAADSADGAGAADGGDGGGDGGNSGNGGDSADPSCWGTCGSGTDSTGKACPPDYGNGKPPCPAGCTAVPDITCASADVAAERGTLAAGFLISCFLSLCV